MPFTTRLLLIALLLFASLTAAADPEPAERYFGEVDNDSGDLLEAKLDAVNYLDVAANWYVMDDISLKLSFLNLLAEDPPIFSGAGPASFGNGNTYPTVYDTSRAMIASVKFT